MALYHPHARALSLRDNSGCITPTIHLEGKSFLTPPKDKSVASPIKTAENTDCSAELKRNNILSPPLSPYQRSQSSQPELFVSTKVYIPEGQFKIENYQEYDLVVNPWQRLSSEYKKRQFNFLDQYMALQQKELASRRPLSERRVASAVSRRRAAANVSNSNGLPDSESEFERIRTRRTVKEHSSNLSEYESTNSSSNGANTVATSPKRRKTTKPAHYGSSPVAV